MAPVDKVITTTANNQRTLIEWVKDFRIKKLQMKRKSRDLRVCAILTTALNSAERELRRKQQERFNKWIEMQSKLDKKNLKNNRNHSIKCSSNYYFNHESYDDDEEELKRRQNIDNLWNCELKGLDEFMKNISRTKT